MEIADPRVRGTNEHARFHQQVISNHPNVNRRYKYYSLGITVVTVALLAASCLISFKLYSRPILNIEGTVFDILILVPVTTVVLFLCDYLTLSSMFTRDEQRYLNELPHKLLRCDLFSSEKRFTSATQPNGFIPDQLFINGDAEIVICDTKTRNSLKVYKADIDQLCRYAVELAGFEGRAICHTAYIRCVTPRETRFLPVKLRFYS